MDKLSYTSKSKQPYKHISTFLAPEGSFYVSTLSPYWFIFPVMYITVWKDPKGFLHTIPVWEEEMNTAESELEGEMQVFVENRINENRSLERCLTCKRFLELCKNYSLEEISDQMKEIADYVFTGEVKTTPELRNYFKDGEWGNLKTMENDGSLYTGWEATLNKEGSLKKEEKEKK